MEKLACITLCGSFHTTPSAVLVPLPVTWHYIGPGSGPVPDPIEVLSD